ncbi:molecular chaperone DnaJ [Candidatus Contubernalis alkaliaceticus]|uniref:molecular chaperone DnaJ n=1 Tax=Candidatus Contubernalis alkaliaceticus TaxID=338645 RepID=UPI001F4C415D|nr:molecular chaperone DnaJ [Candidatus Contubernalis alkalaceticus]
MASKQDYYEVLGLNRDASADEIKKAYRKFARKYHPDFNAGDEESAKKFKEVKEAYDVLADSQKRAHYDQFGHVDPNQGQGFDFSGSGFGGGFEDIFDSFFGGGFRPRRSGGPQRGSDLRYDMEVSFEEAAFGKTVNIKVPRMETCNRCDGSGAEPGTSPDTCPECKGSGEIRYAQNTAFGRFINVRACSRCQGEGRIITDPCTDCSGAGRVRKSKKIEVKIPAGVERGTRLRVSGEGEAGVKGGPPGDLYVILDVAAHEIFQRRGDNIYCEIPISFVMASLGGEIMVPTLEGKAKLRIPDGTKSGTFFKIKGKGIPRLRGMGRGDQHVKVVVDVPAKLTAKQKELLKQFAKESGEDLSTLNHKGIFDKVKDAFGGSKA